MPRSGLVVDIETTRPAELPALAISEAELNKGIASNWGAEARAKHRAKNRKEFEEGLGERAPLDYRLGEMAAVGFAKFDGVPRVALCFLTKKAEGPKVEDQVVKLGTELGVEITLRWRGSETALLGWTWDVFTRHAGSPTVGFGLWDFDLPWLVGRSAVVGLAPPANLDLSKRYPSDGFVDWADRLSFHGSFDRSGWSLARYASLFDLKPKPFGEGKDFPERFAAEDFAWCIRHLTQDLVCTLELHRRFAGAFGT